jgi:phasin family protein
MSIKPKTTETAPASVEPVPAAVAAIGKGLDVPVSKTSDDAARADAARADAAKADAAKADAAKAAVGPDVTQANVKQGMEKAMKTAEDLVAFSQGNVEAVMKSGQIWAAGVQDLSKQVAATAQASIDETMATFRALASVRSFKDAIDLQASFARATLEKTLTESGKLTDASFRLTEQALAPITARVTLAVEKFAKSA